MKNNRHDYAFLTFITACIFLSIKLIKFNDNFIGGLTFLAIAVVVYSLKNYIDFKIKSVSNAEDNNVGEGVA